MCIAHLFADQPEHTLLVALHQRCIVALKGCLSTRASRSHKGGRAQQRAAAIQRPQVQRLVGRVCQGNLRRTQTAHTSVDPSTPAIDADCTAGCSITAGAQIRAWGSVHVRRGASHKHKRAHVLTLMASASCTGQLAVMVPSSHGSVARTCSNR